MADLTELIVEIKADLKDFEKDMKDIRKSLEDTEDEAKDTGRGISKAFESIGRATGIAAAALGGLVGAIVKTGISYNAMIETATIQWDTLLGSQQEAQKMLKDLQKFAATTQFEFEDVNQMAVFMHNAGLAGQDLFNELTKIADVAGAFSVPAAEAKEMARQMSQVHNAGVAYTEDLNILEDRGIPIMKTIAAQTGITTGEVKKMASEGKITSDIYITAFDSIAKNAEGMSKKSSESFSGMLSTFKDVTGQIAGILTTPLFEELGIQLANLLKVLDTFKTDVETLGIGAALSKAFEFGFDINEIIREVKAFYQGAKIAIENENWQLLGELIGQRLGDGLGDIGTFITDAFEKIDWFQLGIDSVARATEFFIGFALNFVDGIIEGLINVISKDPAGFFLKVTELLIGILFAPAKVATSLAKALGKIPFIGTMIKWFVETVNKMGKPMREFIEKLWTKFKTSFTEKWTDPKSGKSIIDAFLLPFRGAFEGVRKFFTKEGWAGVSKNLDEFVGKIGTKMANLATKAVDWGVNLVKGLIDGFNKKIGDFFATVGKFTDGVITKVEKILGIKSPSKVFEEIGKNLTTGMAIGITKEIPKVELSLGKMNRAIFEGAPGTGATQTNTINQNFYSPQSSPSQLYRQQRQTLKMLGAEMGFI